MRIKNILSFLKIFGIIFLVDMSSNILLLLFFGVPLSRSLFIGSFIFTLALTLILKLVHVLKED